MLPVTDMTEDCPFEPQPGGETADGDDDKYTFTDEGDGPDTSEMDNPTIQAKINSEWLRAKKVFWWHDSILYGIEVLAGMLALSGKIINRQAKYAKPAMMMKAYVT
jgi:hypothetical protein